MKLIMTCLLMMLLSGCNNTALSVRDYADYQGDRPDTAWFFDPTPDDEVTPGSLWVLVPASTSSADEVLGNTSLRRHAISANQLLLAMPPAGEDTVGQAAHVKAVMDEIATTRLAEDGKVFIVGFGDGASVALDVSLESGPKLAGVLALAGRPSRLPSRTTHAVSTFFLIGENDKVVPTRRSLPRCQRLGAAIGMWYKRVGIDSTTSSSKCTTAAATVPPSYTP
ncbi:MAG: hypothetical protein U5O39_15265 [Gammaproteobacteria bacterium]|nr:hypothetical protein [Gammaproteobacteria bacterium]